MINPKNTKMDLNVRTMRNLLSGFENMYGKKELINFMGKTGIPLDYFENENNWVSFDYYCNILNALVEYTGGTEVPYKYGMTGGTGKSWGTIKTIITSFASCAFTYKTVISLSPRWAKSGKFQLLEIKKNKAIIEYKLREDLKQTKNNCLIGIQSQLASVPTYWNLPPAKIHELQCAAEGADSCIYEIKWRNPPFKKTGFYCLLAGIIISALIYMSGIMEKSIISLFSWSPIIIIAIALVFIQKIILSKETLKKNSKEIEEQNKILEANLLEIEKLNEILQKKVEERTEELTFSNKEIEKNIKDLNDNEEEMIQTGKMTMVGHVSVDIANKLKKPVDKIQQNLIKIINKTADNDPIYGSLTGAKKAIGRCEKIVNDLLFFSRDRANLFLQDIDVNKIIDEVVINASEIIADPQIKIKKELSDNLPKINFDYMQMKQVFMIIIMNAYDAISDAIIKDIKKGGEILIKSSLNNEEILIEISDTGSGISKEIIGRIFEPFFSTKPAGKKKGIGLTIGYNAIKHLGGRIQVDSGENKGTRFAIYLPVKNQ